MKKFLAAVVFTLCATKASALVLTEQYEGLNSHISGAKILKIQCSVSSDCSISGKTLTISAGSSSGSFLKLDGSSVMLGNLNMGDYGINEVAALYLKNDADTGIGGPGTDSNLMQVSAGGSIIGEFSATGLSLKGFALLDAKNVDLAGAASGDAVYGRITSTAASSTKTYTFGNVGGNVCIDDTTPDGSNCPPDSTGTDTLDDLSNDSINALSDVTITGAGAGELLIYDTTGSAWKDITMQGDCTIIADGTISCDHTQLSNLTGNDNHTQYAHLAGRASPQTFVGDSDGNGGGTGLTIRGSVGANDDLRFETTSDPVKGSYILADLVSCATIKSDANGVLSCDPDDTGSPSAINDLTDVTITSAGAGEILIYDTVGTAWKDIAMQGDCTLAANGTISCDHTQLSNLTGNDNHTQYALLTGRTSPQTLIGDSDGGSGVGLTLQGSASGQPILLNSNTYVRDPGASVPDDYNDLTIVSPSTETAGITIAAATTNTASGINFGDLVDADQGTLIFSPASDTFRLKTVNAGTGAYARGSGGDIQLGLNTDPSAVDAILSVVQRTTTVSPTHVENTFFDMEYDPGIIGSTSILGRNMYRSEVTTTGVITDLAFDDWQWVGTPDGASGAQRSHRLRDIGGGWKKMWQFTTGATDTLATDADVMELGNALTQPEIRFQEVGGSNYVGIKSPASITGNTVWELPGADGTAGYYLKTDGNKVLGWAADDDVPDAGEVADSALANTYAILAGRTAGQTLIGDSDGAAGATGLTIRGSTGANDDLRFETTSNASKGSYILADLVSCATIKSDANGVLSCDPDDTGAPVAGQGIAVSSSTVSLKYTDTLASDPGLGTEECVFTTDGTGGGGFICEGTGVGDSSEQLYIFPAVNGANTTSFIAVDDESVTDFEGTSLSVSGGQLSVNSAVAGANGSIRLTGIFNSAGTAADPQIASGVAGNGLVVNATTDPDSLDVALLATTDGTSVISNNYSGLEMSGAGDNKLALLQGCTNNAVLKWGEGASQWSCAIDEVGTDTLDDLSNDSINALNDVTITAAAAGELLIYDTSGSAWKDVAMSQDCTINAAGQIECTQADALETDPTACTSYKVVTDMAAAGTLTCTSLDDNYIPDGITASNYVPLAGGSMTGALSITPTTDVMALTVTRNSATAIAPVSTFVGTNASGAGSTSTGLQLLMRAEDDASAVTDIGALEWQWADLTAGVEDATMRLKTLRNNALTTFLMLKGGTGDVVVPWDLYVGDDLASYSLMSHSGTKGFYVANTNVDVGLVSETSVLNFTPSALAWSVSTVPTFQLGTATMSYTSTSNVDAAVQLPYNSINTNELTNGAATYAKIQNVSATGKLLGRASSGAGIIEEIACDSVCRGLLDDTTQAAQRATIGAVALAGDTMTGQLNVGAAGSGIANNALRTYSGGAVTNLAARFQNEYDATNVDVVQFVGSNRATGTDDDLARLRFALETSAANTISDFARIEWQAVDAEDTSKDGGFNFQVAYQNNIADVLHVYSDGTTKIVELDQDVQLWFEGVGDDIGEVKLLAANPGTSDYSIVIPAATGTIVVDNQSVTDLEGIGLTVGSNVLNCDLATTGAVGCASFDDAHFSVNGSGSVTIDNYLSSVVAASTYVTVTGDIMTGALEVGTSGSGIAGTALSGVSGAATTNYALWVQNEYNASNVDVARFLGGNRTTGTSGDLARLRFALETDSAGTYADFARIEWRAVDAANASKDGALDFWTMYQNNPVAMFHIYSDGTSKYAELDEDVELVFEGATDDIYQTRLSAVDTTGYDKDILLPNATGTVFLSNGSVAASNDWNLAGNDLTSVAAITLSGDTDTGITGSLSDTNEIHFVSQSAVVTKFTNVDSQFTKPIKVGTSGTPLTAVALDAYSTGIAPFRTFNMESGAAASDIAQFHCNHGAANYCDMKFYDEDSGTNDQYVAAIRSIFMDRTDTQESGKLEFWVDFYNGTTSALTEAFRIDDTNSSTATSSALRMRWNNPWSVDNYSQQFGTNGASYFLVTNDTSTDWAFATQLDAKNEFSLMADGTMNWYQPVAVCMYDYTTACTNNADCDADCHATTEGVLLDGTTAAACCGGSGAESCVCSQTPNKAAVTPVTGATTPNDGTLQVGSRNYIGGVDSTQPLLKLIGQPDRNVCVNGGAGSPPVLRSGNLTIPCNSDVECTNMCTGNDTWVNNWHTGGTNITCCDSANGGTCTCKDMPPIAGYTAEVQMGMDNQSDSGTVMTYIGTVVQDPVSGTEDASMVFSVKRGGSKAEMIELNPSGLKTVQFFDTAANCLGGDAETLFVDRDCDGSKDNDEIYADNGTLTMNYTGVGNAGASDPDNLQTYTIPASTLSSDGDVLSFRAAFKMAANTNSKQFRMLYGGTTIFTSSSAAHNGGACVVTGTVIRTGAATEDVDALWVCTAASGTPIANGAAATTATETLSNAIVLKGVSVTTTADNDIIMDDFRIWRD